MVSIIPRFYGPLAKKSVGLSFDDFLEHVEFGRDLLRCHRRVVDHEFLVDSLTQFKICATLPIEWIQPWNLCFLLQRTKETCISTNLVTKFYKLSARDLSKSTFQLSDSSHLECPTSIWAVYYYFNPKHLRFSFSTFFYILNLADQRCQSASWPVATATTRLGFGRAD